TDALPHYTEQYLFLGLVPLLALAATVAAALRRRFRPPSFLLAAVVTAGLCVVITLSVKGFSLYGFALHVPGTRAFRAMSRVALLLAFPAAQAVAWWLTLTEQRLRAVVGPRPACLLVGLALPFTMADQATAGHYCECPKYLVQLRSQC